MKRIAADTAVLDCLCPLYRGRCGGRHLSSSSRIVYCREDDGKPLRVPGRRTGIMVHAGIAEYAAILTGIGGDTLAIGEPSMTVIAVVGGILFLFWLVVFKL